MKRFLLPLLIIVIISITIPVAFAAGMGIDVNDTGANNQISIEITNWDSSIYGIQFDFTIDSQAKDSDFVFYNTQESCYKKVLTSIENGKTTFTVYMDNIMPISLSKTAKIGTLTLTKSATFTTSGKVKTLDADMRETEHNNVVLTRNKKTAPSAGGEDYNDDTNQNAPNWDSIDKIIDQNNNQKTATIDMLIDNRLSFSVIENLKKDNCNAILDFKNYRWIIESKTIGKVPSDRLYYNMAIDIISIDGISEATNNSDIIQFETSHSGALPFTANLVYPLGKRFANKTVYLSYFNESSNKLEYISSAKTDENGVAVFAFKHFSKYVITSENLWGASASTSKPNSSTPTVVVPTKPTSSSKPATTSSTAPPTTPSSSSLVETSMPEELLPSSSETPESIPELPSSVPEVATESKRSSTGVFIVLAGALAVAVAGVGAYLYIRNKK